MAKADLALRNCKYVAGSRIGTGSILVKNGRIAAIKESENIEADRVIDCKGKTVIPGPIDAHVHIYSPSWLEEDFASGTRAAAAGGVTTVFDMPSVEPSPTNNVQAFLEKRHVAERDSVVNFGLYGGEVQKHSDVLQISDLAKAGAIGFKMILGGAGFIDDDGVLYAAFEEIRKTNSVAVIHAENAALVELFRERTTASRSDAVAFLDARPQIIEEEAVQRAILFARYAGNRIHIAHLSSKRGLDLVAEARRKEVAITAETCPQYLLLSRRDYEKYGHLIVVTPPIRNASDQKALWDGLTNRTLDVIATDHCAFTRNVKDKGKLSVWDTPGGIPGLETLLPLMLTHGFAKRRMSLQHLARLVSESPARIFGLYPRKGVIRVGSDADLTVLDLKARYRFSAEAAESVGDFSPFDGWQMKGKPVMTVVNGRIVMEDGEVYWNEKAGKFVQRAS